MPQKVQGKDFGTVCRRSEFHRRRACRITSRDVNEYLLPQVSGAGDRWHEVRIPAHENELLAAVFVGILHHLHRNVHVRPFFFYGAKAPRS